MVRPGPHSIRAGAAPGGLVVHVYSTVDGALLTFGPLDLGADIDALCADQTKELRRLYPTNCPPVCLVFYDGDTGRRMVPPWAGRRL